eukprot:TRINITY_DN5321_c0_g1_i3.p2 TRINITY_DN5321_c0_g1~~TRINITY_DN5321_c0_g1_i3.p2  ORF type:complete len:167 (-),score=22.86 TRINITY_DN5321_c0_g1_i3:142-642(-)
MCIRDSINAEYGKSAGTHMGHDSDCIGETSVGYVPPEITTTPQPEADPQVSSPSKAILAAAERAESSESPPKSPGAPAEPILDPEIQETPPEHARESADSDSPPTLQSLSDEYSIGVPASHAPAGAELVRHPGVTKTAVHDMTAAECSLDEYISMRDLRDLSLIHI